MGFGPEQECADQQLVFEPQSYYRAFERCEYYEGLRLVVSQRLLPELHGSFARSLFRNRPKTKAVLGLQQSQGYTCPSTTA